MGENETSENNRRRIQNSIVSNSFRLSSDADAAVLKNLFVKTGNISAGSTSDAWQYFGDLYCKH